MGRHVVISFEDNADAEEFIAAVKVEGAVFFQGADTHFKNINTSKTEVIGLFGKPTNFCECPYKEDDKYIRGETFGWYVHTVCKRPRGGQLQSTMKNLLDTSNVLPKDQKMYISVREGETRWPEPSTS